MAKKWLQPGEGVMLEDKAFVWVKTPLNYNGSWARIFLTNKRFYANNRFFKVKVIEFAHSEIRSVTSDEKNLRIDGEIKGKKYYIKIRKKGIGPSWEWMIKQRMV